MAAKTEKATKTVKAAKAEGESKVRVKGVKALARERVLAERKAITKNLRSIEKLSRSFEKAQGTLAEEVSVLEAGEFRAQLESVLKTLGVAVEVTRAQAESDAMALARTFMA